MKLNDFKKIEQQINEGFWDAMIGDKNVAKIKSIKTGATTQQQLAQDIFIKDFMGDARSALNAGVKGGSIDPKIKTRPTVNTAGGTGAAAAAQQYNKQKQTTRDVNQYLRDIYKSLNSASTMEEKVNLSKELINYMADRKGTPEWTNAQGTVKAILTKHLSARNLPIALDLIKQGKQINVTTTESKFVKLNNLFESMLTEAESVGSYMQKWFSQYMKGVDYSDYANDINQLIKRIEQNYPKIKPDLNRLAQMAYSISKGKAGGASNAQDDAEQPAQAPAPSAPAQPAQRRNSSIEQRNQIIKDLQQLRNADKAKYEELIKMIKGM